VRISFSRTMKNTYILKSLGLLALLTVSQIVQAQYDTLRLMHYNLLNYRNFTTNCTNNNNKPEDKEADLNTILSDVLPDVLTVNEMGANWLNPNRLLNGALNQNGRNFYDQAEYANNTFSSLTNMLFYNKEKLVLHKQTAIKNGTDGLSLVRIIDVYTLYNKHQELLDAGDTTFLTFVVCHLKAGSTTSDKTERARMTEAIIDYLSKHKGQENVFVCGDFNIQSSSEESYKNLVEESNLNLRLYDPMEAPGTWNNRSIYANLHTQSTRTSGSCHSGGGLDDRFDFILMGKEVRDRTQRVAFVKSSYKAYGNDSRRFNGDINTPANNAVSAEIATALYNMSDHLPVVMDIAVGNSLASDRTMREEVNPIIWQITDQTLDLQLNTSASCQALRVYTIEGKTILEKTNLSKADEVRVSLGRRPGQVLLLQVVLDDGTVWNGKIAH
jgi:exonuclease III